MAHRYTIRERQTPYDYDVRHLGSPSEESPPTSHSPPTDELSLLNVPRSHRSPTIPPLTMPTAVTPEPDIRTPSSPGPYWPPYELAKMSQTPATFETVNALLEDAPYLRQTWHYFHHCIRTARKLKGEFYEQRRQADLLFQDLQNGRFEQLMAPLIVQESPQADTITTDLAVPPTIFDEFHVSPPPSFYATPPEGTDSPTRGSNPVPSDSGSDAIRHVIVIEDSEPGSPPTNPISIGDEPGDPAPSTSSENSQPNRKRKRASKYANRRRSRRIQRQQFSGLNLPVDDNSPNLESSV